MKQFKVCLTSLLQIDFSEFEKERLILSCSLVDILAARKDGFFALFSDFIKIISKIALFLVYKKYRDFPRAGARATQT